MSGIQAEYPRSGSHFPTLMDLFFHSIPSDYYYYYYHYSNTIKLKYILRTSTLHITHEHVDIAPSIRCVYKYSPVQ